MFVPIPQEFGGGFLEERDYDGYGNFDGNDIYALVAKWNKPELCKNPDGSWKEDDEIRGIGIDIACYDEQNFSLKYPIKITATRIPYERAKPSLADPDQGWHVEDDDYEYAENNGYYW